ncbi:acyl-CoA dehydratase activase [Clostridium botulinum]|uniref:acyl-CoA dehydratase activase n=1 Tax=Clostridium botulinum TaxID=1491 RepID=UPI001E36765C|nr:acyl-CoA dehydratase activase [Clostridium botulinum]MCC5439649.1 acyl-CoA dehydratase activase [Clostridium botulinum]NFR58216.1 3-hydroxyacyl-ACP dehydratase [Clostridium botulinum]
MVAYTCKYAPLSILEAFDEVPIKINHIAYTFDKADVLMHPNMCTYCKSLLENLIDCNSDQLILMNCCDSMRRLYDVLKSQSSIKYLYMMDLPHKNNCCSRALLKESFMKFINNYEKFSGKKFNIEKFKLSIKNHIVSNSSYKNNFNNNRIAILGGRCDDSLVNMIENCTGSSVLNLTCTGENFILDKSPDFSNMNELILWYAEAILSQAPCMRMSDISYRKKLILSNNISGIIYNTVKFCDYYSFEYASIKKKINIPILKIETDYTNQSRGQLKTRIEAFIERLKDKRKISYKTLSNLEDNYYVAGIDSGSTSTNIVILDKDKNIISYSIVSTGAKSIYGAKAALDTALEKADLSKDNLKYIVSTGYGRVNIPFANENVTEITCHGIAAHHLNPSIRTVMDIGGQDSKVIKLDENGNIKDFAMNDKCAAGTGRFLDMMARTLQISIDEMSKEGLHWEEELKITNMCTVFAESEVVSLIAENKEKCDIIHGLNDSIASKMLSLLNRVGKEDAYMMTGGVAKNLGVVKALEKKLKNKIFICEEPQICGSLGAALIALKKYEEAFSI